MSTRRITFEKQQRERAKKEKAALKRERRQQRKAEQAERGDEPEEEFQVLDGPPEQEPFDPELA